MLQGEVDLFGQHFLGRVLGQEQHVEACVGGGQVADVAVPLDVELESPESLDGHPVSARHESHEVLLLFLAEGVQKLPKIPI